MRHVLLGVEPGAIETPGDHHAGADGDAGLGDIGFDGEGGFVEAGGEVLQDHGPDYRRSLSPVTPPGTPL